MNGEQAIPPITDPLGANWKQPHRRYIELDETHALMSEQTFKGLMEYSCTSHPGNTTGRCGRLKEVTNGSWHGIALIKTLRILVLSGEKY